MSEPAPATFRVDYDAGLVEECVLLSESRLVAGQAARFRAERDRIYAVADAEEREARFEELHGRFFVQFGLDRPLHEALAERPELLRRARGCRILRVVSRRDEMADVRPGAFASPGTLPILVLRLRPQSLLEPDALRTLLRRELLHAADMLDPDFGYVRELPGADADPAFVNLLRDRYRVLWDATIDGRLLREGRLGEEARALRLAEFARAFPMLGETTEAAFAGWFDAPRPSHAALVDFILEPLGPGSADDAHCPLCRLPAGALQRGEDGAEAGALAAIRRDHPGWSPQQGACARCLEVYAALTG